MDKEDRAAMRIEANTKVKYWLAVMNEEPVILHISEVHRIVIKEEWKGVEVYRHKTCEAIEGEAHGFSDFMDATEFLLREQIRNG